MQRRSLVSTNQVGDNSEGHLIEIGCEMLCGDAVPSSDGFCASIAA
jgi:hypothetical protein